MTVRRVMGAVDAIMRLSGPVDVERLKAVVQNRLIDRYPVFRQMVVEPYTPLGMPHWEDDDEFSIDQHLHRVQLPERVR